MNTQVNRVWMVLLVATAVTYWLGESGSTGRIGIQAIWLMMGLACLKGYLVIFDFMDLRHAPSRWRWMVVGWLLFVIGLIIFAYWIGVR